MLNQYGLQIITLLHLSTELNVPRKENYGACPLRLQGIQGTTLPQFKHTPFDLEHQLSHSNYQRHTSNDHHAFGLV